MSKQEEKIRKGGEWECPLYGKETVNQTKIKKEKIAKQPSPNVSGCSRGLAQDPNLIFFGRKSKETKKKRSTIKRTFPFTLHQGRTAGSMTVEAALVLPLFLFFFLNLGSVLEIMRLHGKMETALWEVGRETGVYGSALRLGKIWKDCVRDIGNRAEKTETNGSKNFREIAEGILEGLSFSGIGDIALSQTYVKTGIVNFLGSEYLYAAPIRGGPEGLYFLGSNIVNEDDVLEIIVTYPIEPFWAPAAFRPFLLENRYYGRLWTGYDVEKAVSAVFYLTDNEEVFHTDRSCTHLLLSVRQIPWTSLASEVNERGQQYRMCEKCMRGWLPKDVWIAREGDCFHARRDCPGLKRIYRAVTWEEAKNYRPCSRCGYR